MSYQLRRINPFWFTHPMIPTGVAIGLILGAIGYFTQRSALGGVGAVVAGIAILAATRPAVSTLFLTLGLLGGVVRFALQPDLNAASLSPLLRWGAAGAFGLFYMVLMDAVVLVVAVLYNLFTGVVGLSGLRLELDAVEDEDASA
jgi:hypothetical protein